MASPNPTVGDLVATTIESRTGELADNVSIHMPLLKRLKQRGNIENITGGTKILEEIEYAENGTTKWYSGYETLDVSPQEIFTAAEYDIRQLAGTVTTSGLEDLVNDGNREAKISLAKRKIQNLDRSLMNTMARSVHSDGTGNGGKQLLGLQAFISSAPTSGTVGNIDRAAWAFWRNKKFSGVTDGGAAITSANIRSYMRRLALLLVRNDDFPDLITLDTNFYNLYAESLTPFQRVTGNDAFGSGFKALKFYEVGNECDVIFAGADVGMPSNTGYFQNTRYLRLRPHSRRNMTRIGDSRKPINQDASIEIVGWAGNMTCSNMALQGVLIA
jgi:hypothetical protein